MKKHFLLIYSLLCLGIIAGKAQTQTFTSSGTWTAPCGVTSVEVQCWGAGQGGEGGTGPIGGYIYGGVGGEGGDYAQNNTITVTPGNVYTVTVGIGGTGGAAGSTSGGYSYPLPGGDSKFTGDAGTVLAKGGGSPSSTTGTLYYQGGLGGGTAASNGTTAVIGAGGGGGAGSGGSGGNGTACNTTYSPTTGGSGGSGSGGSGGFGGGGVGGNGNIFGGGGGGGEGVAGANTAGGNGANGQVILTWTLTALSASAVVNHNVTCLNGANGSATVIASGGTSAYTYSWNPSAQTTSTATGLTAQAYTCTVSNANGCTIMATVTLTQPTGPIPGTNIPYQTYVIWNWNRCVGDTAYYYNTVNNLSTANRNGTSTTYTQTGLAPNTSYTLYVWGYDSCGNSTEITLTQILPACSNSLVYCIGGIGSSGSVPTNNAYNTSNNTWTTEASMPSSFGYLAAASVENIIYCIGFKGLSYHDSIYAYNTNTNTWTKDSPMPISNSAFTATAVGNIIYCIGGDVLSNNYTYNTLNNTWTTEASIPTATEDFAAATVGDIIYCIGGMSSSGYVSNNYAYNTTNNTWATEAPIPKALGYLATAVVGNIIYCIGGANNSGYVSNNYAYNTTNNTWATEAPIPIALEYLATAVVGNIIYCIGGKNNSGNSNTNYAYNTTNNTWTTEASMPTALYGLVALSIPSLMASISSQTNVTCFDGHNGNATVIASNGTETYNYRWNDASSQTTATASNLIAAPYTCTVTDGCTTATETVTITQPALLRISINVIANISCNSGSNGSVSANPSGGTTPYTYSWTGGGTNVNYSGLSIGTYTITLSDSCGSNATASVTITQPNILNVSASITANISCNGGNKGIVSSTPFGGTSPYTYSWTGGGTNSTQTGLSTGTYTITLTDNCGATATASATITQPAALGDGSPTINQNVLCYGESNGSATAATPTGGTAPYTYQWNTGATSLSATNATLSFGTYAVNITDAHGCTATSSSTITITQPAALGDGSPTINQNVLCYGESNGSATAAIPTGGTSPYTFSWSGGGGTNSTANGLSVATYTVVVQDNCGASATASVTITQPNVLRDSIITASTVNVRCSEGTTGSAIVGVKYGTSPYTYSWSGGRGTNSTAYGLSATTYTVAVHDNCGAIVTESVTISQPIALSATASTITNVSCYSENNGSASASLSNGTSPYTYSWSPSGGTNSTAGSLRAGTYTITVHDNCGATATASATITQPTAFSATASETANVGCNGASTGTATATASNGTSPYTYLWAPIGGTGSTANVLSAGTYTVTITDHCGISFSPTVVITQPIALTTRVSVINDVTCYGYSTGNAIASSFGGTSPYTYSWAPSGGTNSTISNLSAGTCTITLIDNCGNIATASTTITQPTALIVTHDSVNETSGCNGIAGINVSGGTLPYTYYWSAGHTNDTINNQCAGTYTCIITDNNDCSQTTSVTIKNTTGIENISNSLSINIYPDPNTGYFTVAGVSQGQVIELYNYMGQLMNSVIADNNTLHFDISAKANGIYLIRILNKDGSVAMQNRIIKIQ